MLKTTGVPTKEDINSINPGINRLNKGPVAVIECFQEIPCNPCSTHCHKGAIADMTNITERPKIDYDKCSGCGICSAACPGLAIFIIDMTYSENKALVKIPYEFLPLPKENEIVPALNREGIVIDNAEVVKIQKFKNNEKTPLLWLAVSKENAMEVRNIRKE